MLTYESDKTPISAYLNKLDYLKTTCGETAVLENLGLGMLSKPDSDGAKWFLSLSQADKMKLMVDYEFWKSSLTERFQKDRGGEPC